MGRLTLICSRGAASVSREDERIVGVIDHEVEAVEELVLQFIFQD